MRKIKDLANKLNSIDFISMCEQSVMDNESHAMELNNQQLFQGERADGTSLPDYSFVSVNFFNKPSGPIRLFDTGDFYNGFIFSSSNFPFFITSKDSKTDDLQERYGSEIFGLTQENLSGFAKVFILPTIGKKLRDYLGIR